MEYRSRGGINYDKPVAKLPFSCALYNVYRYTIHMILIMRGEWVKIINGNFLSLVAFFCFGSTTH